MDHPQIGSDYPSRAVSLAFPDQVQTDPDVCYENCPLQKSDAPTCFHITYSDSVLCYGLLSTKNEVAVLGSGFPNRIGHTEVRDRWLAQ